MKHATNKKLIAGMVIVLLLIAAAILMLIRMDREHSQLVNTKSSVSEGAAAIESTVSLAQAPQSAREVSESAASQPAAPELKEPTSGTYREELKQVAGAALPNVSVYADAARNAGTPGAQESNNQWTSTNGKIVCIDPGHQDHGMSEKEPNAPGSSTMKAKLTTGTSGIASGKDEYEVNLEVSLQLRDELERRGYTVVMTRETNNVNISNVERALIANDAHADIFVRIHCNSLDNSSVHGALTYQPSSSNPYLSGDVIAGSQRLAQLLLDYQIQATGQRNAGIIDGDDMTGINWAQMPVTIVEMGFMSNPDEDLYISGAAGQAQIVQGLANGIDAYFAS